MFPHLFINQINGAEMRWGFKVCPLITRIAEMQIPGNHLQQPVLLVLCVMRFLCRFLWQCDKSTQANPITDEVEAINQYFQMVYQE